MGDVALVPATIAHLEMLARDRGAFAELIGSAVPEGWPKFPEAVDFTVARLWEHPDEGDWWMHVFMWCPGRPVLVGSGGFTGPPIDGTVEIGYEIAPTFRGRGFATAAAEAMIAKALSKGVKTVVAHTLPTENASTTVLCRLHFRQRGEVPDDECLLTAVGRTTNTTRSGESGGGSENGPS